MNATKSNLLLLLIAFFICIPNIMIANGGSGNNPVPQADDLMITDANWGTVPVGVERPKEVEITNLSKVPITINSINWSDKLHFTRIQGLPFPTTIDSGETYVFIVYYKPDKPGMKDSTRAIFTASTASGKLYSDWVGRGSDEGPQVVGYDFGKVRVIDQISIDKGITEYKFRFTLKNIGGATFQVKKVEITNDPDNAFTFNQTQVPTEIKPAKSADVDVVFKPLTEKQYNAQIKMTVDLGGVDRTATAALTGIGALPHIQLTGIDLKQEIYAGQTIQGNAVLKSLRLSDVTNMQLNVTGFTIEGDDSEAFKINEQFLEQNPFPIVLSAGMDLSIPIMFTAQKGGQHNATLKAIHDAPENPTATLKGIGKASPINVISYDYGNVEYDDSTASKIYLANTGTLSLLFNNIELKGDDAASFELLSIKTINSGMINPEFPFTLEGGDTVYVEIAFKPREERAFSAYVNFNIDEFGDYKSQLSGVGVEPTGGSVYYESSVVHSLKANPNPIERSFVVEFYAETEMTAFVSIYDIFGREVFRSNPKQTLAGNNKMDITLPFNPAAGVYYIVVGSETQRSVLKTLAID